MCYLWRFNLPGVEPVLCDPLVQSLVVVHVVHVVLHHATDLHAVVARHKLVYVHSHSRYRKPVSLVLKSAIKRTETERKA